MPEAHPAHQGLPALYRAELGVFHNRWVLSAFGPDRSPVVGPNLDVGPADARTTAEPDDPGRYLIEVSGETPVPPVEAAAALLQNAGFVVEGAALADRRTDHGWTQTGESEWTAPCQPVG